MRLFLLLTVAAMLSAEAPAPAPADLQQYEQALAAHHVYAARIVVDKLIRQRVPADGKPLPDPLLNAMIGRLYLASHQPGEASIYLDHAPLSDLPPPMRAPTALDHARALDLTGNSNAALAAYQAAAAMSDNADQRRQADIGIAHEMVERNPSPARDELLPIANGAAAPERWEARYLLAVASSLLGDGASARKWADEAWADAPSAALADLAPLRVETLRAGLAAAAQDTATERAMLTSTSGLALTASASMSEQLPVCGDAGVQPSDFVIFGFVAGPFLTRELMPIAASRPAAVLPFYNALAGASPVIQGGGDTPIGTVFTVRCRTIVSSYYTAQQPSADPFTEWSVSRGLYYASVFNESDDQHLKAVQTWIDELTRRFGSDSPLLIMPRWQLLSMLKARGLAGDPVLPGELTALHSQVAQGLRRAGAPDWLTASAEMQASLGDISRAGAAPANAMSKLQGEYRKLLLQAPFNFARQFVDASLSNMHDQWPSEVAQLVLDLNAHAPATLGGRERQAWESTVASALRALGRDSDARATLLAAGIPKDVCGADDSQLRRLEEHFSYNDYPEELIAGDQEGAVFFEFGLSPLGTPIDPRAIYSLPSGLFDAASAKGLATLRYTPPTRGGTPVSCTGVYQPIRWQLQSAVDFSLPFAPRADQ